jgi:hypothetical protein
MICRQQEYIREGYLYSPPALQPLIELLNQHELEIPSLLRMGPSVSGILANS